MADAPFKTDGRLVLGIGAPRFGYEFGRISGIGKWTKFFLPQDSERWKRRLPLV